MTNELEDSGKVRLAPTGAQRDSNEGKGRYDLISPIAIARLARINQLGAAKRGDRNWEQGMPLHWFVDSALRHIFEYLEGRSNEDHLAQAFWNVMCAMHTEEMVARNILPSTLMDLPNYFPTGPTNKEFLAIIHDALQNIPETKVSVVNTKEQPPMSFTLSKPLRFYVGGPYSDDNPVTRRYNTKQALAISTQIARRGHYVLSPHAATGYLDGVMPYEYFMDMDFSQIIAWANAHFHIADSPGADRERKLAKEKGNPIFTHIDQVPFVEPNKYAPLNEQPNDPRSSFYQPPAETDQVQPDGKGAGDGDSAVGQTNQAEGGHSALHNPHRHPDD